METETNGYHILHKCGDQTRPVYLAESPTKELVVLKRNNPGHFIGLRGISVEEAIKTSIKSLEHEREILDRLYSPDLRGICEVLDWINGEGYAYLVINYAKGEEISILKKAPKEKKLKAIRDVAKTLLYAHNRGIIHRDISPSNIRVDPNLTTTLLDWSLAYDSEKDKWNQYTLSGTVEFMSPQQAAGFQPTPAQDVYSLSLVALELITKIPVSSFKWDQRGTLIYPYQKRVHIPKEIFQGCNHREEERPKLKELSDSLIT